MKKNFLLIILIIIFFNISLNSQSKQFKIAAIIYGNPFINSVQGLKDGLKNLGYKDVKFYVYNIYANLNNVPEILNKIYKLKIDLIFATTTPLNLFLKSHLKKEIPVIFNEVADPVGCGLVKSLKSSGNNFTGVSHVAVKLLSKQLEIFKDLFPDLKNIYIFINPTEKFLTSKMKNLSPIADILNLKINFISVKSREDIKNIYFYKYFNSNTDGLLMGISPFVMANVDLLIKISKKNRIPFFPIDNIVLKSGGCVGYSPDFYKVGYQSAYIADKIFKGANPSDIPIEFPEIIQLILNLNEIKSFKLNFNHNYLMFANKVIK